MVNIQNYFTQSELSLAAYADLANGSLKTDTQQQLLRDSGMTSTQAANFANTYTVIDRKSDRTGLSVTLFEKIQPNADGSKDQHVAIRGTQRH